MVYLTADGSVVEKRSLFRLSLPLDILWGVIDFVSIFFQTLIDPEGAKAEMRRRPRGGGATGRGGGAAARPPSPVSYTHLTLPTILLV